MPEGMEGLAMKLFSQGFQQPTGHGVWGVHPAAYPPKSGRSQGPGGVWDNSTSSRVAASLFMDDTALLAKSEAGLVAATYVTFCKKVRMRVNASKLVVMRFMNATIAHKFELTTGGGVVFKSPKPKS